MATFHDHSYIFVIHLGSMYFMLALYFPHQYSVIILYFALHILYDDL